MAVLEPRPREFRPTETSPNPAFRTRSADLASLLVESAWGAVPGLLLVCSPGPLAEPLPAAGS
jgi:hypothetical protein